MYMVTRKNFVTFLLHTFLSKLSLKSLWRTCTNQLHFTKLLWNIVEIGVKHHLPFTTLSTQYTHSKAIRHVFVILIGRTVMKRLKSYLIYKLKKRRMIYACECTYICCLWNKFYIFNMFDHLLRKTPEYGTTN